MRCGAIFTVQRMCPVRVGYDRGFFPFFGFFSFAARCAAAMEGSAQAFILTREVKHSSGAS